MCFLDDLHCRQAVVVGFDFSAVRCLLLIPVLPRQSITVTQLEGYNEVGTVDMSPLRRGENASSGGGGEIYSCGGSVEIAWSHTGLLEELDVRVSVSLCFVSLPPPLLSSGVFWRHFLFFAFPPFCTERQYPNLQLGFTCWCERG